MGFPRGFNLLGAVGMAAWMAALACPRAGAETRTPLFTADQEACFGRVYDQGHLASHPDQKVTGIHIFRPLGERKEAETWRPDQREQAIKSFRETGQTNIEAFVTFHNRRGYFHNSLICDQEGRNGVRC